MNIWAIADLHLSLARPDHRERYARRWRDHTETIEQQWRAVVRREDLVLLPGDLSMARNHRDVQLDLAWLDRLPGTKVLSAGNHDAWWNNVQAIRPMLRRSLRAVGGDALATHGVVVCGTLGAPVPPDDAAPAVWAAAEAEAAALARALDQAAGLRKAGEPLYVLWHYPPFDPHRRPGPCVPLLEAARASACAYGHLHSESQWALAVQGEVRGVRYHCVAADAIGFRPLRIGSSPSPANPGE